jgi:parallel beta-helix repeat protein
MDRQMKKFHFLTVCILASLFTLEATSVPVPGKFLTISAAMAQVKKGDTIKVEDGIYKEQIYVNPGVVLIANNLFKSIIDGNGKGTVVTMGNGATISGFQIRNGTFGVFSTSAGVTIVRCMILNNQQTGVMCVGHLPRIEDNLIIFNKGSGIQGWDVQSTSATVNHNTISMNSNHGISIGGNSSVIVENNIISNNDQFGVKAGDDKVRITMISNNFFQNAKFTGFLPVDNYSLDPMFKNVQQFSFTLNSESKCIGRGSDNQDIGARLVY